MKKLTKTLVILLITSLALVSCNKDDDESATSGNILGDWEFVKEGTIINGQEVLAPYDHAQGCEKDFVKILSNGIAADYYHENDQNGDCFEYIDEATWTKNGNSFILTYSVGESANGEILVLNETTLKIKFTEIDNSITIVELARR